MTPDDAPLTLEDLGWSDALAADLPEGLAPARVSTVYGTRIEIWTPAEGRRMAVVRSRAQREAPIDGAITVGDWVGWAVAAGEPVVERVLPRRNAFLRKAAGLRVEPQAVVANVDRVLVVTSLDGDYNVRRLERYLEAIASGGAEATIVFAKADAADPRDVLEEASALAPVLVTSAHTGVGMDALSAALPRGTTVALVGSSGVGKSALVNALLGRETQTEGAVREHDRRGRHTTTRRDLFRVPGGGLLVDTPGMRELEPWRPPTRGSTTGVEDRRRRSR